MNGEWNRLNARMLAVHPVQEVVRLLPVLIGVLFIGRGGQGQIWSLVGLGLAIAAGLLRWFTTTYQITADHVRVRRGLLSRKELSVPRDRIRTVDLTSRPLQRILGLSRVVIGTGRADRTGSEGVTLDSLATAEASRLREELLHRRTEPTAGLVDVLAELQPSWVRFGPFTLSGIAAIGVVVGSLANLFNEVRLDEDDFGMLQSFLGRVASAPVWVLVIGLVVLTAVLVSVLSVVAYVLAFWNFRLARGEGTLRVTRGLLTTRQTTIELRRLRGAEISEPLLLRAAKGARCSAITTGLRGEHSSSVLLPPAPRPVAHRVVSDVLDDPAASSDELTRHGPRAHLRRYTRAFLFATGVTAALVVLWRLADWPAWPWQVALVLFPAGALLAEDRYRNLGHALTGGKLVFRQGSLVRRRQVLSTDGVIGWVFHRSFFQRRAGLLSLTATTAAGRQHYTGVDIPATEAVALADAAEPGLLEPFLIRR
ncbi:PH domain-containing protein [Amycolatopsis endophytica]|uniref:Putative membrane protein n=1 Tax=Amycolatopsis endophytica TaxID=860233 RepID=A0A853B3R2_9PSEU|nr:PH domain-containing protein [Amycolatopsis endophytica]NYI89401.1 putative membrane protein [Amycolatopsis endophytica]